MIKLEKNELKEIVGGKVRSGGGGKGGGGAGWWEIYPVLPKGWFGAIRIVFGTHRQADAIRDQMEADSVTGQQYRIRRDHVLN